MDAKWQTTKGIEVGDAVGYIGRFRVQNPKADTEYMDWRRIVSIDRSRRGMFDAILEDGLSVYCGAAGKMWVRKGGAA